MSLFLKLGKKPTPALDVPENIVDAMNLLYANNDPPRHVPQDRTPREVTSKNKERKEGNGMKAVEIGTGALIIGACVWGFAQYGDLINFTDLIPRAEAKPGFAYQFVLDKNNNKEIEHYIAVIARLGARQDRTDQENWELAKAVFGLINFGRNKALVDPAMAGTRDADAAFTDSLQANQALGQKYSEAVGQ